MKTIYIDSDFKCHTVDDGTMRAVETPFFDGKCDSFIENHRYIPSGESWKREDGEVFYGEMITAWRDYEELDSGQRRYEHERLEDAENALFILLGGGV